MGSNKFKIIEGGLGRESSINPNRRAVEERQPEDLVDILPLPSSEKGTTFEAKDLSQKKIELALIDLRDNLTLLLQSKREQPSHRMLIELVAEYGHTAVTRNGFCVEIPPNEPEDKNRKPSQVDVYPLTTAQFRSRPIQMHFKHLQHGLRLVERGKRLPGPLYTSFSGPSPVEHFTEEIIIFSHQAVTVEKYAEYLRETEFLMRYLKALLLGEKRNPVVDMDSLLTEAANRLDEPWDMYVKLRMEEFDIRRGYGYKLGTREMKFRIDLDDPQNIRGQAERMAQTFQYREKITQAVLRDLQESCQDEIDAAQNPEGWLRKKLNEFSPSPEDQAYLEKVLRDDYLPKLENPEILRKKFRLADYDQIKSKGVIDPTRKYSPADDPQWMCTVKEFLKK